MLVSLYTSESLEAVKVYNELKLASFFGQKTGKEGTGEMIQQLRVLAGTDRGPEFNSHINIEMAGATRKNKDSSIGILNR